MDHFKDKEIEIDLYLNTHNDGSIAMKRVNYSWLDLDKYEVLITGINKCPNNTNGWIPHFVFRGESNNQQSIQCARINKKYYRKSLNLNW